MIGTAATTINESGAPGLGISRSIDWSYAVAARKTLLSTYRVDTDAITAKEKQKFAAKEKAKKVPLPAAKTAKRAA